MEVFYREIQKTDDAELIETILESNRKTMANTLYQTIMFTYENEIRKKIGAMFDPSSVIDE